MKKFTKWALGCTIACAAVGLGLSVAGLAMGAATSGKDVLAKALDDTLNSDNIRWSVSVLRDEDDWDDMDESWNHSEVPDVKNGVSVFEFENLKNLEVELSADELYLKKYDGRGFRVEVNDNDDKVRVRQDKDSLKIKSLSRMSGTTITVYYADDLNFEEIEIEVDAGSIHMEDDMTVHELDIQVGAGELISDGTLLADEISLDVGTGNAEISALDAASLEAECGVGALHLTLLGNEDDYSYKVECGLGNVEVGSQTYGGISETVKVNNENASRKMKLECGLGSITVDWQE